MSLHPGEFFCVEQTERRGGEIHQNPTSVKRQSGITAPLRVAFIPFARLTAAGT